jgi:type III secretory pathway lipoprotein EscJ
LPRVVDVKVSVSIPRDNPLRDPNDPVPVAKASVILVYQPDGSDVPPLTTEDVQRFVQAKLEGLKAENVSVLLIPSKQAKPSEGSAGSVARVIDPAKGCEEKEKIFNLDVCAGNKKKVIQILVVAGMIAGVTSGLAVVAVLRALRYRKDITRLTAQFAGVKK